MSDGVEELDGGSHEATRDNDVDSANSATAHKQSRDEMAAEVEAYLAKGGEIEVIEPNVMADPPRKPQSNYGSRPI